MRNIRGMGGFAGGAAAPAVFDPSTLALTGWYRDFSVVPWAGLASGGDSGNRTLQTTGSADPVVGTPLNAHGVAAFDGSTSRLKDQVKTIDTYIARTKYRVVILASFGSNGSEGAAPYSDPGIFGDATNGLFTVAINDTHIRVYHYDGADRVVTMNNPGGSAYHLIDVMYDGAAIRMALDGAYQAFGQAGTLNVGVVGEVALLGSNYNGSKRFAGNIADVMVCDSHLADTPPSKFKEYVNARYGLSL